MALHPILGCLEEGIPVGKRVREVGLLLGSEVVHGLLAVKL